MGLSENSPALPNGAAFLERRREVLEREPMGADWVMVLVPSLDRGQCRAHLIRAVCLVGRTQHHGEGFALFAEGDEKQCVLL